MVQVEERLSSPPQRVAASTPPTITLDWYPLAFAALVLAGFLLRIHRLAERAVHHDEMFSGEIGQIGTSTATATSTTR